MQKLSLLSLLLANVMAAPVILNVEYQNIVVNGKTAKVMTIKQPDGTWGYYTKSGDIFDVTVKNKLNESTVIHWHGLELPNNQDGTELNQPEIAANGEYHYQFPLKNSGTFWMHSHHGLQEISLAEAPLIIETPDDKNYQQVVVMFQDFSFKKPEQILSELTNGAQSSHDMHNMKMTEHNDMHDDMAGMDMDSDHEMEMESGHGGMAMNHGGKGSAMVMDLNDVKYDAFLTNYHTPQTPQITQVTAGKKVKLRFINGSASSGYWINLGKLSGSAVAVDGHDIKPLKANKFQLSEGQRIDIVVTIPASGGVFPILGQVEGLKNQTGLVLTTQKNLKTTLSPEATTVAPALNDAQELKLQSTDKFVNKPVDRVLKYTLTGNMSPYVWQINGQSWPNVTPFKVKQGQRVEMDFTNKSMMSHPMHLHGYTFKVVEVNGHKINGALRDTVLILPGETVKVVFDANETGKWFLHCHLAWHMPTGMMTYLEVDPATK